MICKRQCVILTTLLCCCFAAAASAEVQVDGSLTAVRIKASGEALSDVLSTFAAAFALRYRSAVPLPQPVTGSYAGSLSQVMARLLTGYNYVIIHDQEVTEIVVVGESGGTAVAAKSDLPVVASQQRAASRWR